MSGTVRTCRRCGGSGAEPNWRALGAEIRRRREEMGLTLRELARRAGCSPAYLHDLEHGRRGGGLRGRATRAVLRIVGLEAEIAQRLARGEPGGWKRLTDEPPPEGAEVLCCRRRAWGDEYFLGYYDGREGRGWVRVYDFSDGSETVLLADDAAHLWWRPLPDGPAEAEVYLSAFDRWVEEARRRRRRTRKFDVVVRSGVRGEPRDANYGRRVTGE